MRISEMIQNRQPKKDIPTSLKGLYTEAGRKVDDPKMDIYSYTEAEKKQADEMQKRHEADLKERGIWPEHQN